MGEPEVSRCVESDWKRRIDGDGVGNEGRWMAQRAAHAATQNESKRMH
jgi:hypothetical protein